MRPTLAAAAVIIAGLHGFVPPKAMAAELVIGMTNAPQSLDPHYQHTRADRTLALHLYDRLVEIDNRMQITPGLAESWGYDAPDVWRFHLRDDAVFHDGSPVTAEDVLYSMERAATETEAAFGFSIFLRGKSFSAPDSRTVQVQTPEPYPDMLEDLARIAIVKKDTGGPTPSETHSDGLPIGSGPYRPLQVDGGEDESSAVVLEGLGSHWSGAPRWERVTFRHLPAGPERVKALIEAEADLIDAPPEADIQRLQDEEGVTVSFGPASVLHYLYLGQAQQGGGNPLADIRIRAAISLVIDRTALSALWSEGRASPAAQFLSPDFPGALNEISPTRQDSDAALFLLNDAGHGSGFTLRFVVADAAGAPVQRLGEMLVSMLSEIRVQAELESVGTLPPVSKQPPASQTGQEPNAGLAHWHVQPGDPLFMLRALVHTPDPDTGLGMANRGHYSNTERDALIGQALAASDPEQRFAFTQQAMQLALEDMAVLPLVHVRTAWAMRDTLRIEPRADDLIDADAVFLRN